MDKPIECRNVDVDTFRKLNCGLKSCWIQQFDRDLKINDRILIREVRGDLLTGRSVEIVITDVEINEYCPEGYCLISFQVDSVFAKIAPDKFFGLLFELNALRDEFEELQKKYNSLLLNKEVV